VVQLEERGHQALSAIQAGSAAAVAPAAGGNLCAATWELALEERVTAAGRQRN
jgi:hypothetical protein